MTKFRKYRNIFFLLVTLGLNSCSVDRFVPADQQLYTGASLELKTDSLIKNEGGLKTQLESVIRPEPNAKILGMQPGLYFHYKAQQEKPGFINKFLNKKIGEEPVYLSDVNTTNTENLLLNRLENRGFFYSKVSSTVATNEEEKSASVSYIASVPTPYRMENYRMDSDSLPIYKEIQKLLAESPIKPGMRFDLSNLKLERARIDQNLKNKGYYNFSPTFLIFEADTNQYSNKRFDLFLKLKKGVPQKGIIPYKIKEVNVHPNYVLGNDTIPQDTVELDHKNYIQPKDIFFKPKRLEPYITIEEGQYYDPEISRNTSRRLGSIGAYKFVNIEYNELENVSTDSLGALQANIFLSPLKKRALRLELQAVTKSNNFTGPNLNLTFSNRNLFKGGETLNLTLKAGYEKQFSGGNQAGLSSTQLGIEGQLIFPRVLSPIHINEDWFEYSIPKTKISLSLDYLNRTQLFSLYSASANFGYVWNANRYITHEFNPISINYVKPANETEEFEQILAENPFLENSFEQQFISGLTYSFTYNEMVDENKTHQFFLNSTWDIAGNSIDLFGSGDRPRTFLGLEYAQYAKADVDFRYHFNFGKEQKIATRIFAGIGLPYGNSEIMPFTKQYFSGGPYSVRAFKIRSLGPGTYSSDEEGSFYDQSGNIRLEANVEYRFPLISFLKGALFADAGNVWNTKANEAFDGQGKFSSDFINEFGIGVGAGLRVDIQSFVIRLDLAAPVHTPYLEKSERWDFRTQDAILNFAIGYPF